MAQEGLPWAMRWAWANCPTDGYGSLDLDWDAYGEATELWRLSFDYYHLYRCFVLYSRGIFSAEALPSQKKVRFLFRSKDEERRDAARALHQFRHDDPPPPGPLIQFIAENMPVINAILPHYIDKIGDSSIRYTVPAEMFDLFKRWATLQADYMRFELPGSWQFAGFNLHQFRSFWKSLFSISLSHAIVHDLSDGTVGTRGGAISTAVMNLNQDELLGIHKIFDIPVENCRSIIETLTYNPARNYWDPIWQPIVKLSDQSFLLSPRLITTSSPERNLMTLLVRSAAGRRLYDQVSFQKEEEQLSELEKLFQGARYAVRRRIGVPRVDGSTLTDIDLLVFDSIERFMLLIHAKWLARPDFITETLAKDNEVQEAIRTAIACSERVTELGTQWVQKVVDGGIADGPIAVGSVIVNRDFIPSGWIYDQRIPTVDLDFVRNSMNSQSPGGLRHFYDESQGLDDWLKRKYPFALGQDEIRFGEYTFDLPTIERPHN